MNDDVSARLGLPYLAAGQLRNLNEALTRLDALIQTAVVSRTTRGEATTIRPRAPSTSGVGAPLVGPRAGRSDAP